MNTALNAHPEELEKFSRLAARWWDPDGESRPLHDLNPVRTEYVASLCTLKGVRALDVGCGGGLLSESLTRAGARVTALDLAEPVLRVARMHALESALEIDYQLQAVEQLAETHAGQFDVVTCMEMLEHVPDPQSVITACAKLVRPGGRVFFSTLNRSLRSFLGAIVAAEYVLELLPRGTHDHARFIRPSELDAGLRRAGLQLVDLRGLHYNPLTRHASLVSDVSINYLLCAERPA